jgi:5-methylcytosine-specific restriction endonuclease McrA
MLLLARKELGAKHNTKLTTVAMLAAQRMGCPRPSKKSKCWDIVRQFVSNLQINSTLNKRRSTPLVSPKIRRLVEPSTNRKELQCPVCGKYLYGKENCRDCGTKTFDPMKPKLWTREFIQSSEFLSTFPWRQLRMQVLIKRGNRCECCGASPMKSNEVVINVDHIKPRKTHPELALVAENLQILCGDCNHGKGNWNSTDWRN